MKHTHKNPGLTHFKFISTLPWMSHQTQKNVKKRTLLYTAFIAMETSSLVCINKAKHVKLVFRSRLCSLVSWENVQRRHDIGQQFITYTQSHHTEKMLAKSSPEQYHTPLLPWLCIQINGTEEMFYTMQTKENFPKKPIFMDNSLK